MTPRLLTARQVAGQLGFSPETVLRWTRCGELPAIKLPGGAIRYREDVLDEWLSSRSATSPATPTATLHVTVPNTRQGAER